MKTRKTMQARPPLLAVPRLKYVPNLEMRWVASAISPALNRRISERIGRPVAYKIYAGAPSHGSRWDYLTQCFTPEPAGDTARVLREALRAMGQRP